MFLVLVMVNPELKTDRICVDSGFELQNWFNIIMKLNKSSSAILKSMH